VSVLTVTGLGKAYRRYRRELDRIRNWFGANVAPSDENWVLKDITFAVPAGQALGIVGRNGAGKSTLLKIITGTARATTGTVAVNGRVAAILELGMGFNPEFTGRANVYHAAGMMGFTRPEIEAVIPEIESFSELGDYFDQPLRVYSSGMQVRLAFAVATAIRPDILIIDEALSVGDAYFQHKSFERIRAYREQGTTLILVSHDKAALQSICDRAILLDKGTIALDGDPEAVLDYYNALMGASAPDSIETHVLPSGRVQTISGTRQATIETVTLHDADGRRVDTLPVDAEVEARIAIRCHATIPRLVLGYAIKDRLGQTMFGTNTHYSGQAVTDLASGDTIDFAIRFKVALGPGSYSMAISLSSSESHLAENYEWRDLALVFDVVNLAAPFDGKVYMPPVIAVSRSRPG
jgi:lipopolysaccharide transport system ATP-binding protein